MPQPVWPARPAALLRLTALRLRSSRGPGRQAVAAEHPPGLGDEAHLQSYLDEFVFRFNRRRSRSRGLVFYRVLELAAGHDPVRYRDVDGKRPRKIPPVPPAVRGHPPSLERPPAQRPWRAADLRHAG